MRPPYLDPPKRVAIVGSRTSTDPRFEEKARAIIHRTVAALCHGDTVISGGADGVDSWAEEIAGELGVPCRVYLPETPRWEPRGYKARNTLIARDCTSLLAIRCAQATSYGSGWTADLAQQLQKPVTIYRLHPAADEILRCWPEGLDTVTPPL